MKRTMTPPELVEHNFDKWIFGGLVALSKSKGVCLTFVIMACAIDYLASFNVGGKMKRIFALILIVCVVFSSTIFAEELILNVNENIRSSPEGQKIGELKNGVTVEKIGQEGNWIKFRLEGWIWAPSVGLKPISTGKKEVKSSYQEVTIKEFLAFPEEYFGKNVLLKGYYNALRRNYVDEDFYCMSVFTYNPPSRVNAIIRKKTHRKLVNLVLGLKHEDKITVCGKGVYGEGASGFIDVDDIKVGW